MAFNVEHPIEFVINGCSSGTSAKVFLRTQVHLDTNDYDGATYFLEMVAYNSTGSSAYPELVYWDGDSWETAQQLTVSATTTITRYRTSFTPQSGAKYYALRLPATGSVDTLRVLAGRIIVRQTSATKTRIQIPILTGNYSGYTNADDSGASLLTVSGATYTTSSYSTVWKKIESNMSGVAHWDLEVVAFSTGGTSGYVGLYNKTDASIIADSEVYVSGSTFTYYKEELSHSATGFHDADEYDIRAKNDGTNTTYVAKANLYVTYSNPTKCEVYNRLTGQIGGGMTAVGCHWHRMNLAHEYMGDGTVSHYLEVYGYSLDTVGDDYYQVCSYNDASTYDTLSPYDDYAMSGATMDAEYSDSTKRLRRVSFTPNASGYDYWGIRLPSDANSLWTMASIVSVVSGSAGNVTLTSAPQFGIG